MPFKMTNTSSPMPFLNKLSPSALFELEEYDETLADMICQPPCPEAGGSSSAFTVETAHNSIDISSSANTVGSGVGSVCSFEHSELRQLGCVGSGTYCRVGMVTHDGRPEIMAQKVIDPRRLRCRRDLNNAADELANEAKILSGLDHVNIIKLRGVSSERFSESFVSGNGGYFLIMDILSETLRERLNNQTKLNKHDSSRDVDTSKRSSFSFKFRKSSSKKPALSNCEKLYRRIDETALGIARGMKYLHSKDVVLRDLKPENIGFENIADGSCDESNLTESTVKLFDFGMASKVEDCDPTEICGSPRYMAPEVMSGEGYSLAVDVYSFGVVLYEMCALKRPFEETYQKIQRKTNRRKRTRPKGRNGTIREFYKTVVDNELKPSDKLKQEICCPKLRSLIEVCWDHDPTKRPTFDDIFARLVEIFFPNLFAQDNNSVYLENLRDRDLSGGRSVSIQFDSSFEREDDSCDGSTVMRSRETKSYP